MRGFLLDEKGDIVIKNNEIVMTEGNELLAQTIRIVLGTNKGEWFDNSDEGINNRVILGKNPITQSNNLIGNTKSGDLSEAEELKLAALLKQRLDGDI